MWKSGMPRSGTLEFLKPSGYRKLRDMETVSRIQSENYACMVAGTSQLGPEPSEDMQWRLMHYAWEGVRNKGSIIFSSDNIDHLLHIIWLGSVQIYFLQWEWSRLPVSLMSNDINPVKSIQNIGWLPPLSPCPLCHSRRNRDSFSRRCQPRESGDRVGN